MSLTFLLLGFVSVFVSQKIIVKEISHLIRSFGGGKKTFIRFWSILFLPGTLIHEVSHLLFAAAMGLRTGEISIFPEFVDTEGEKQERVKLGSVQVSKMNPIQGFLVGFAPLLTGVVFLVWMTTLINTAFLRAEYFKLSLFVYLFFAVANSFFPSKEDIRYTLPFIVIVTAFVGFFWYFGIKINPTIPDEVWRIVALLTKTLLFCSLLNLATSALMFILRKIVRYN